MSWSLDKGRNVWKCTEYSDLQYDEIINFAQWGQPRNPYQRGFLSEDEFLPDFKNVVIEMPQAEVMAKGYGQNVVATDFPVVNRFLTEIPLTLPVGSYTFAELVARRYATSADRTIRDDLYGSLFGRAVPGTISPGDAAFIHGSVSFRLKKSTRFVRKPEKREVYAEIGAGDDNWDFESSNWKAKILNPGVFAVFVDVYNLEAPIQINFVGSGKTSTVAKPEPRLP